MFQQAESRRPIPGAVATAGVSERVTFLRKTYAHLGASIFLFAGLCYLLLDGVAGGAVIDGQTKLIAVEGGPLFKNVTIPMLNFIYGSSWLLVLALFMGASWLANRWANSDTSRSIQYLGLAFYVLAEALIFTPILFIADVQYPGTIGNAAIITLLIFAGLTATVFVTKKDFSFLRGALTVAGFGAIGLILAASLFGFTLGSIFSVAMIAFAAGYILYDTSNVLHYYRPTQYVAAALALFSSVALMFWYVLRLLMELNSD